MKWTVPRIWEGGDCWILGGGPSLTEQFNIPKDIVNAVYQKKLSISAYSPYMKAIHDKHVIGVNMAYKFGDWVDICFFGDKQWYFNNRSDLIANFRGMIVGCANFLGRSNWEDENVRYLARDVRAYGISNDANKVGWNKNSGAAAISIAVHAGCKRVILLGFDMKLDAESNQHWHKEYKTRNPKTVPFARHLIGFEQIAYDAKRMGVEIINASPKSAITQFKKMTVKEILNEGHR